jgi:hypothetical protein
VPETTNSNTLGYLNLSENKELNYPNIYKEVLQTWYMVKVIFIKGSIEVVRKAGKEYVRIYVYSKNGGKKLVPYANREIEGMVVIDEGS